MLNRLNFPKPPPGDEIPRPNLYVRRCSLRSGLDSNKFKYHAVPHVKCCLFPLSYYLSLTKDKRISHHLTIIDCLPHFLESINHFEIAKMRTAAIFAAAIAFVAPVLAQSDAASVLSSLPSCGVCDVSSLLCLSNAKTISLANLYPERHRCHWLLAYRLCLFVLQYCLSVRRQFLRDL